MMAPMPLCDGLRVVKSGIHGYGVVTTRPFARGELVCFGDGVLYPEDADFDDTYALILPGEDSGLGENFLQSFDVHKILIGIRFQSVQSRAVRMPLVPR